MTGSNNRFCYRLAGEAGLAANIDRSTASAMACAAGTDEQIHGLPHGFDAVAGPAEGSQGAPNHLDSVRVGALDHLLHSADQIVRGQGRTCCRCASPAREVHVVNAFQDHQPFHAWLAQHIAVETGQRGDSCAVTEDLIAGDAHIQYGNIGSGRVGDQTFG